MSTVTTANVVPASPITVIMAKLDEYGKASEAVFKAEADKDMTAFRDAFKAQLIKRHEIEMELNLILKVSNPNSAQAAHTHRYNFILRDTFGVSQGKLQAGASSKVIGGLAVFAGVPFKQDNDETPEKAAGRSLKELCVGDTSRAALWNKLIDVKAGKDATDESRAQAESDLIDKGLELVEGFTRANNAPKDHAEVVSALVLAKSKS